MQYYISTKDLQSHRKEDYEVKSESKESANI